MKRVLINLPGSLHNRTVRCLKRLFTLQLDRVPRITLADREVTQLRRVIARGPPALRQSCVQDGQGSGDNAEEDVDDDPGQFFLILPGEIEVGIRLGLNHLSHHAADARERADGEEKAQSELRSRRHPHLVQHDERHRQEGKIEGAVDDG